MVFACVCKCLCMRMCEELVHSHGNLRKQLIILSKTVDCL